MDKPRLDVPTYIDKQQCMWVSAHAQKINISVSMVTLLKRPFLEKIAQIKVPDNGGLDNRIFKGQLFRRFEHFQPKLCCNYKVVVIVG